MRSRPTHSSRRNTEDNNRVYPSWKMNRGSTEVKIVNSERAEITKPGKAEDDGDSWQLKLWKQPRCKPNYLLIEGTLKTPNAIKTSAIVSSAWITRLRVESRPTWQTEHISEPLMYEKTSFFNVLALNHFHTCWTVFNRLHIVTPWGVTPLPWHFSWKVCVRSMLTTEIRAYIVRSLRWRNTCPTSSLFPLGFLFIYF